MRNVIRIAINIIDWRARLYEERKLTHYLCFVCVSKVALKHNTHLTSSRY